MKSHHKALMKAKESKKVGNLVETKMKDRKGVKAKLPYSFLKNTGAEEIK